VVARSKGVPSPLLGVASHRPHRHGAWKNVASFRIGNLLAKARIRSNVALPEKNSVSEQKLKSYFCGVVGIRDRALQLRSGLRAWFDSDRYL